MPDLPLPALDFTSDGHVHTPFCNHAEGSMEEYVQSAISSGITSITFLEHLEANIHWKKRTWLTDELFDTYFTEGGQLQKRYAGRIKIGLGVECGWNLEHRQQLRERLLARNWAEIGISCHFLKIPEHSNHLNLFSRSEEDQQLIIKLGTEELFSRYLNALEEAVEYLPATKLCHLDGAMRHIKGWSLTSRHLKQIDSLLRLMKEKGMKLEINTSGFPLRGEQFPALPILLKARTLGLEFIMGSDAHRPRDVGQEFQRIPALFK
ncbi:histidinol-phosphatase [Desulforhopalus vacuolatus]|uniref:histidinol-phosphatase n=1 Tax=Desulforhopalus vacuolatus TaxID=40414 RepID=UPI00196609F6|nr:histidinol-phosphatase [Desulforhopalus vacuolatus]MBM9518543.1 histidinol-phosphatase [Desulforhopalus vacuolatus]